MAVSDEEIRKMAKDRVDFKGHLATYLIINTMLVGIWFFTTRGSGGLSGFWPGWTMLFWGVGLAFHAFNTYGGAIGKEEERLRRKYD